MAQPRAGQGRRNPALLAGDDNAEQAMTAEDFRDESHGDERELDSAPQFLFEGDVVTANVTLALDFGDGRTNFVGYKATTKTQPNEDAADVYARIVTVVNEGVVSAADDVEERLAAYREERQARLERVTGGRQP